MIYNFTKESFYPTSSDIKKNSSFDISYNNQSLKVIVTATFRVVIVRKNKDEFIFSFSDFIANLLCVNCVFFKTKLRLLKKNKFYNIYVTGYDEPIFNFFKTDLRVFLKKNYFLFINTILKQNQFLLYNRDKKKVLNDLIENLSSSVVGKQCACQLYGIFLNTNLDQYSCLSIKKTVKLLYVLVIVIIYKRILKSVN